MRTTCFLLFLSAAAALASGCNSIGSSGDSLPSAAEMADADFYDPWPQNGYTMPLPRDQRPGRR